MNEQSLTDSNVNLPGKMTVPPISQTEAAKWAYSSLGFSVFYLFNVIINYENYSTLELVPIGLIYLLFLGSFVGATRTKGNKALGFILAIIAIAGLGTAITPGTNALFGYATFLAGYYFSARRSISVLVINLSTQVIAAYAFDYWHPMFLGPSMAVTIGLQVYGVFSQKEYLHKREQSQKNQQIEQLAAIAERERIARDMHDLLGHSLSSLALKSELSQKLIDKGQFEAAAKEITEVAELARQSLSEVRHAVTGLKQKGLVGVVKQLEQELKSVGKVVRLDVDVATMSPQLESCIIMIIKECCTNTMRHSKGSEVTISIKNESDKLTVSVTDNGKVGTFKKGNGLQGIESRVQEQGGHVKISASEEQGFGVFISLPNPKQI